MSWNEMSCDQLFEQFEAILEKLCQVDDEQDRNQSLFEMRKTCITYKTMWEDMVNKISEKLTEFAGLDDKKGRVLLEAKDFNIQVDRGENARYEDLINGEKAIPHLLSKYPEMLSLFRASYSESGSTLERLLDDFLQGEPVDEKFVPFLRDVASYRVTSLAKPKIEEKKKKR